MAKPGFGVILGENNGVVGYSNRGSGILSGNNEINGIYTGIRYQCVEYARRWLISVKGLTFGKVRDAHNMWPLTELLNVNTQETVKLIAVGNGGELVPHFGAILIYRRACGVPWGHVAIITEVDLQRGVVRVAEQNVEDLMWPGDYSRELRVEVIDGKIWLRDKYALFGWMMYEDIPDGYKDTRNFSSCELL